MNMAAGVKTRRFSGRQRSALFFASGGLCSLCGCELDPGWHADHVVPWSKGGSTDVINGQALCARCNQSKGDRMASGWPENVRLRDWQESAFKKFMFHKGDDFLAVATPGAGKTAFALRCIHEMLRLGAVQRVVIVAPSTFLKRQWAKAANDMARIQLNPDWENSHVALARNYVGACMTYSGVHSGSQQVRWLTNQSDTLVVFDEVHHAGDDLAWGTSIRSAFGPSVKRLCLSGTPFRSDNQPIPFVNYIDNVSCPDFSYSYGDALRDGVVRPVVFPTWDADCKWYVRGKCYEADFSADLDDMLKNNRLKTALQPNNDAVPQILTKAAAHLDSLREDHPEAGGLVTAMDVHHAKQYAKILEKITKEKPIVVVSEDPKANEEIQQFAKGRSKWIVAVRMVSEGVDIPRLRVGVYTTNITTEMYFRQFVGRFVRVQPGREDDYAYLFILRDPRHLEQAKAVEEERLHYIKECEEEYQNECEEAEGVRSLCDAISDPFVPGPAYPREDGHVANGNEIGVEDLRHAEQLREKHGLPKTLDLARLASLINEAKSTNRPPSSKPEPATSKVTEYIPPDHERANNKRKYLNKLVNELCYLTDVEHHVVNGQLKRVYGLPPSQLSPDQLDNHIRKIKEEIRRHRDGD